MAKCEPMLKLVVKRREKGISQKKLAAMLGVQANTICSYETGKNAPSLAMVRKLAAALNCDPRDLI